MARGQKTSILVGAVLVWTLVAGGCSQQGEPNLDTRIYGEGWTEFVHDELTQRIVQSSPYASVDLGDAEPSFLRAASAALVASALNDGKPSPALPPRVVQSWFEEALSSTEESGIPLVVESWFALRTSVDESGALALDDRTVASMIEHSMRATESSDAHDAVYGYRILDLPGISQGRFSHDGFVPTMVECHDVVLPMEADWIGAAAVYTEIALRSGGQCDFGRDVADLADLETVKLTSHLAARPFVDFQIARRLVEIDWLARAGVVGESNYASLYDRVEAVVASGAFERTSSALELLLRVVPPDVIPESSVSGVVSEMEAVAQREGATQLHDVDLFVDAMQVLYLVGDKPLVASFVDAVEIPHPSLSPRDAVVLRLATDPEGLTREELASALLGVGALDPVTLGRVSIVRPDLCDLTTPLLSDFADSLPSVEEIEDADSESLYVLTLGIVALDRCGVEPKANMVGVRDSVLRVGESSRISQGQYGSAVDGIPDPLDTLGILEMRCLLEAPVDVEEASATKAFAPYAEAMETEQTFSLEVAVLLLRLRSHVFNPCGWTWWQGSFSS